MNAQTDQQLLQDYAESRSEAAFAELVRRHIDLVYSAALRMVCNSHLAEDVAQGVFVALAQNARQLIHHPVLSGWLHRTTQNLTANAVRANVRRQAREQEAVAMNELLANESDNVWKQIAPHLDAALGELSEPDRDALLLRYFERKSAPEMAQILGISDEAAQKRVNRAVERLREFFSKRNVTIGAGGLAALISANAVQSAPVGLAAAISAAAVLAGTAVHTSTVIAATKAIAMTTIQKTVITAALAAAVGTGIFEAHQAAQLREQNQLLQQQQTSLAEQIRQLEREHDDATNQLAGLLAQNAQSKSNSNENELLRLRGEVTQLRSEVNDSTEKAAKALMAKLTKLKQRLAETPDAKIPELQFLTEQDWINAANGRLDNDASYRRALSALRKAGEGKFATMLNRAVIEYMKNNGGQMPTDLAQLQPYFDSPIDDAILQRWEVAPANTVRGLMLGGNSVITQKAPVDDQFDTRFGIGPGGFGPTDFLNSELGDTLDPVYEAYLAAHNGQSGEPTAELLPYATTPEQQAAIQKWILHDSLVKQAY